MQLKASSAQLLHQKESMFEKCAATGTVAFCLDVDSDRKDNAVVKHGSHFHNDYGNDLLQVVDVSRELIVLHSHKSRRILTSGLSPLVLQANKLDTTREILDGLINDSFVLCK